MMCDKCGAKSADVELYCKNCGSDLQIFGAGSERVKLSSEAAEREESSAVTQAPPPTESPLGPPPPSGSFPPPSSAGTFPPAPSSPPASFGNLPGFPLSSPPPSGQTPPLSAPGDSSTDASDVPSFLSRKAPSSEEKPITASEDQGSGPIDFSFLGKPAGKKPEVLKDEEEKPVPPPPTPSPGAFSPDFFKPKEDK